MCNESEPQGIYHLLKRVLQKRVGLSGAYGSILGVCWSPENLHVWWPGGWAELLGVTKGLPTLVPPAPWSLLWPLLLNRFLLPLVACTNHCCCHAICSVIFYSPHLTSMRRQSWKWSWGCRLDSGTMADLLHLWQQDPGFLNCQIKHSIRSENFNHVS